MRIIKKGFAVFLALFIAVFVFAGCKSGKEQNTGGEKWVAVTAYYDGQELSANDFFGGEASIVFEDNEKCTLSIKGESKSFVFTNTDTTVLLQGEETILLAYEGEGKDKLKTNISGADVIFEKKK